ncbi:MAG: ribbon-helix-helix domain-containing protein [Fimbriiglobus sp.]|nr:ribbon-helix-helix domain-containing protein [Fimbriiglobus sp.]
MLPAVSWPSASDTTATAIPSFQLPSDDVVEMLLLLPEWQVFTLEEAARDRGMTVAQLVRRLLADLFPRQA